MTATAPRLHPDIATLKAHQLADASTKRDWLSARGCPCPVCRHHRPLALAVRKIVLESLQCT